MMTIRRAVPGDLRTVLSVLHSVQAWLHQQGYDQWPDGSPSLGPVRIGAQIGRGDFWLASDDRDPVAVIALSPDGDPDFWTPAELAEPAMYVSKAAVVRRVAGRGIGALMLRWACDRAAASGARGVRLDVWRTNGGLQDYYRRQGWAHLRTVAPAGRNSGALFWRLAEADPEAAAAFTLTAASTVPAVPVRAGMPVIVPRDGGPVAATCLQATENRAYEVVAAGWEHGGGAPPLYKVERDGQTWFTGEAWPDPALAGAQCGQRA